MSGRRMHSPVSAASLHTRVRLACLLHTNMIDVSLPAVWGLSAQSRRRGVACQRYDATLADRDCTAAWQFASTRSSITILLGTNTDRPPRPHLPHGDCSGQGRWGLRAQKQEHQLLSNCFLTSQIQGDDLSLLVHGGGQASHAMSLAKAMEARHETASVSSGISEGCSVRIHSRSISPLTRRMVLSRRDLLSRVPRVPLRPA